MNDFILVWISYIFCIQYLVCLYRGVKSRRLILESRREKVNRKCGYLI